MIFLKHTNTQNPDTFPFILVGTKSDETELRKVSTKDIERFCEENGGMPYFETSAKNNENVKELFEKATELAIDQYCSKSYMFF